MAFYYSPSQVATFRDCPRKWFYSRTLNRPRRETAATLKGKKIHKQLEDWLKSKTPPENDRAKLLIPLLPLPHESLLIEHEIRLLTPSGLLRGFVDLLAPHPTPDWPPDLPRLPTVFDHKTTIDLWNAKSALALENDPQALLYGLALRVLLKDRGEDPEQDIQCVWNYTSTGSERGTCSVRVLQSYSTAEPALGTIFDEVRQMRGFLEPDTAPAESVPAYLTGCRKYGGCEFADICPAVKAPNKPATSVLEDLATTDEPEHLVTITRKQENTNMASTAELLAELKRLQSQNLQAKKPVAETPAANPEPATQKVTPEPSLSTPDLSGVPDSPSGEVQVVPPDAPAPKRRKKSEAEAIAPVVRSARLDRFLDLFERFITVMEKEHEK